MTLAGYIEAYLATHPAYAPGTAYLYRHTGASLCAALGGRTLIGNVTRAAARDWQARLSGAPGTVALHTRHAKSMFGQAHADGLIKLNPFAHLDSSAPKTDKNWRFVDLDTFHRLIEACPDDGWRMMLSLCRLAGLRRHEAADLRWQDIDLEARRLVANATVTTVTTKKRRRQVPIGPELHARLFEAWMDGQAANRCADIGCPDYHRIAHKIMRAAGVPEYADPFQCLRRSMERDWIDAKFDLPTVAEWMGHSPAVALQHYLRAENESFTAWSHPAQKGTDECQPRKPVPNCEQFCPEI